MCAPKTLLRARECFSKLEEMAPGTQWQAVLDDTRFVEELHPKDDVRKLLICSGKIFYDLKKNVAEQENRIAIVRIEVSGVMNIWIGCIRSRIDERQYGLITLLPSIMLTRQGTHAFSLQRTLPDPQDIPQPNFCGLVRIYIFL